MTARSIQVTLGAGATQVSATPAYFNHMVVQNNGAAARLGDATVSATKGIALPASNAQVPVHIGPFSGMQADASQLYLFGTAAQVVDILLF